MECEIERTNQMRASARDAGNPPVVGSGSGFGDGTVAVQLLPGERAGSVMVEEPEGSLFGRNMESLSIKLEGGTREAFLWLWDNLNLGKSLLRLGTIKKDGTLILVSEEIYDRLEDTGLSVIRINDEEEQDICIPFVSDHDLNVRHPSGLLDRSPKIKEKLEYIGDVSRLLGIRDKNTYDAIKEYNLKAVSIDVIRGQMGNPEGNVKKLAEVQARKREQNKDAITVLDATGRGSAGSVRERMQRTLAMKNIAKDRNEKDQSGFLAMIDHYVRQWDLFKSMASEIHPNAIQSYLFYELICHHFTKLEETRHGSRNNAFHLRMERFCLDNIILLYLLLKELYPDAKRVCDELGVDLQLPKIEGLGELTREEIAQRFGGEGSEEEEGGADTKTKGEEAKSRRARKKKRRSKKNRTKKPQQSSSVELESKKVEQRGSEAIEETGERRSPSPEEVKRQQDHARELTKRKVEAAESKKARKARQRASKARRAAEVKTDVAEQKEQKEAEVVQLRNAIQDVMNRRQFNAIYEGLNKTNKWIFKMLFSKGKAADRKITHIRVKALVGALAKEMGRVGITSGEVFSDQVRTHVSHSPDFGNLLPEKYLQILRPSFILFGLFPDDWLPQTMKDFDAVDKYCKRGLGLDDKGVETYLETPGELMGMLTEE